MFERPVLFAIERGNLIFFGILFLALYLDAKNPFFKALYLALLINIKPYFILIIFQYLNRYKFDKKMIISVGISSLAIFWVTGYFANLDFIGFVNSYLSFSKKGVVSLEGVIALPNSLSALNSIKYFLFNNVAGSHYTFWFSLLKVVNYLSIITLVYILLLKKLTDLDLLIGVFILLTNFSVSTGGYILVIYTLIVPYLINSKEYIKFIFPLLIIGVIPFDWINISQINYLQIHSYLGGVDLFDTTFFIGLGSIIRPIANYSLMVWFLCKIYQNSKNNKLHFYPQTNRG